jgi:hypothetical protein
MGEGFRSEPSLKRLGPLYFGATISLAEKEPEESVTVFRPPAIAAHE